MKKLIFFELTLLFLATTFVTDSPPPGWYQQSIPIGNKLITDIQFLDSLNGWVVTDWGPAFDTAYIFRTFDGGNSWSFQLRYHVGFTAVNMVNMNTGYISGGDGIGRLFKTTNGGLIWNLIYSAGHLFNDVFFVNRDTGWVCDDDALFGVGIMKTINGGINWFQQANPSYRPKKLFFINKDTGWAISNEANSKLYLTTNSGVNWNLEFTFSINPRSIFFVNKDTGYTGGFKSINGGLNWFAMNNYQGTQVYFANGKTGWTGGGLSTMQKTIDGQNWINQTVPSGGYQTVQFLDTSIGWSGGTILIHTSDGGGPLSIIQIGKEIPTEYKLFQNYPNPFNPSTIIRFQISRLADVRLVVYDITGKEIKVLVNKTQKGEEYEVTFDGSGLASGVYFYSLVVDGTLIDTKKMILIK